MADPFTIVCASLKAIIDAEFADELIVAYPDRVHDAMGSEGVEVGIEPTSWSRQSRNANVKETNIVVRFYDQWEKEINPDQQVDPRRITAFADRFERKVESTTASESGSNDVWFFDVIRVEFPEDPTGNKTRFVAYIRALGDNAAAIQR